MAILALFWQGFSQTFMAWFSQHGIRVIVVLVAAVFINYLIKEAIIKRSLSLPINQKIKDSISGKIAEQHKNRILTVISAVSGTVAFSVYIIAILTVLPEFGVDIAPILAGLGVIGLAVGMAARDIITDFLAGFFIIIEDEFNIGDRVQIAGVKGKVEAITFRRTTLRDDDGKIHFIRNNEIKVVSRI